MYATRTFFRQLSKFRYLRNYGNHPLGVKFTNHGVMNNERPIIVFRDVIRAWARHSVCTTPNTASQLISLHCLVFRNVRNLSLLSRVIPSLDPVNWRVCVRAKYKMGRITVSFPLHVVTLRVVSANFSLRDVPFSDFLVWCSVSRDSFSVVLN